MRIRLSALLIVLAVAPVMARAQACGLSFVSISVLDASDNPVAKASIEVLGKVPDGEYKKLTNDRDLDAPPVAVEQGKAKALIGLLSKMTEPDDCGNPFKQRAGTTLVKRHRKDTPSNANFGFCFSEGHFLGPVLVKLSAPGFRTGYFVTSAFYGCNRQTTFQLRKKAG